jgi:hypothetical protein
MILISPLPYMGMASVVCTSKLALGSDMLASQLACAWELLLDLLAPESVDPLAISLE